MPLFLCNGKIQGSIVRIYCSSCSIYSFGIANGSDFEFSLQKFTQFSCRMFIYEAVGTFFYLHKKLFLLGHRHADTKYSFQRKIPIDYYMNIEEMNGLFESTRLSNMNNPSNKEKTIHTILRERGEGNSVEFIKTDIRGTIF